MNHWELIDTEQLEIYQDHIVYRGLRLPITREELIHYPGNYTKFILTTYRDIKINQVLND